MQQMDGATMAAMLKSRFGDSVKVSPDTEQVELTEEQLAEINSNAAADEQEGWWKNSTYDIVSRAGYLLGVPLRIFENEFSPMMMEIYEELQKNREARIIRNLCILRTAILQKFKKINHAIYYDLKNLYSLPEYIPQDALKELSELGINIIKANYQLQNYLIDLNNHIKNHIGNTRTVFPTWIDFNYIRDLFIMHRGTTADGCKAATAEYYNYFNCYPYHVYMNWGPKDLGNLLLNDEKFVKWLYEENQDLFTDLSKVTDISDNTRSAIHDFIMNSDSVIFVVDCENSNAYRLYAAISSLSEQARRRVGKIMLYNDVHTSSTWKILNRLTTIPIEHIMVERVLENKSLVDIKMSAGICREHYKNDVSAFIVAASDSDYWGVIQEIPEAQFLVMYENEKCSSSLKNELSERGIFFCALDDFNTSDATIRELALRYEMEDYLRQHMQVNVNEMLETAITNTRMEMTSVEESQFRKKYIKPMRLSVADDGTASIVLGG